MTDQQDLHAAPAVPPGTSAVVTGATGFIGGRLVERLIEAGATVTCLVRGEAGADLRATGARICRVDLADEDAVAAAVGQVTWAFHCAYDWSDTEWNFAALQSLMRACREQGWQRLVHVSSFVVYDNPPSGELTEETVASPATSGYAHTKIELERRLLKAAREEQLPVAIVQPTIVYGPHCKPWTITPADMLINGTVVLPDQGEGVCNAVFVDDVVDAMILAAREPGAVGQRFLISGDPATWSGFYEGIAGEVGAKGPKYLPAERIKQWNDQVRLIVRKLTTPRLLMRMVAGRAPVKKIIEPAIKVLPGPLKARARHELFAPLTQLRRYVHMPDLGHLAFLRSTSTIHSNKARSMIGYRPRVDLAAGMAATGPYLRSVYAAKKRK
jgi:nucleoside-diphosphate-sugar epimerase